MSCCKPAENVSIPSKYPVQPLRIHGFVGSQIGCQPLANGRAFEKDLFQWLLSQNNQKTVKEQYTNTKEKRNDRHRRGAKREEEGARLGREKGRQVQDLQ